MHKVIGRATVLFLILLAARNAALADGFELEPAVACAFMEPQGLRTRGGYHGTGTGYRCRSPYKNVIGGGAVHNTLRFTAGGGAERVRWLELALKVNSLTAVQRAHRALADHAEALFQAALGTGLPDPLESAILSAVAGQWRIDGHAVTLERIVLGGPGYELRLRID